MTSAVVLDTSVIIKWFRQGEILAPQALALRRAYLEGSLTVAVPDVLVYEVANVLRYKGDLSTEQIGQAVQSLFDIGIDIVPPSAELMRRAVALAYTHNETVYDAVFVALAETLEADFITADEQLVKQMAGLPFVRFLGDVELHREVSQ